MLAVTSELPWPLDTGGHLRTYHLLKSLAQTFDVRLVTTVSPGSEKDLLLIQASGVDPIAVATTRTRLGEIRRGFTAILRREPYVMFHRHNRAAIWKSLTLAVKDWSPDVVYFDHLDSFLYRSAAPTIPWVVDLHNVYSTLVERTAAEHNTKSLAMLLRDQARLIQRMERKAVAGSRLTLSVSEADAQIFRQWGAQHVAVVPNGVDCDAYRQLPVGRPVGSAQPTVIFVGALSWTPNQSAARFLALDFLPRLRERWPDARVQLVGRNPTDVVRSLAQLPGLEVHANVPDVRTFLRTAHVLAVPLSAGGGTRLKILEAFAAGLPVVSTAVGCEGLQAQDGLHLFVAERGAMAGRVGDLFDNPELGTAVAIAARDLAERIYDWRAIGRQAATTIETILFD